MRNTDWDLIQNNYNLRYHKEHKKKQYNCTEPPVFKSQIYKVGYQSSQKLLQHYQLNLSIQS